MNCTRPSPGKKRPSYGKGRKPRRYAYAADVEYDDDNWEAAAAADADDDDYGKGGMTDLEDELNALREDVEAGDEAAKQQMVLLSECLAAEQTAYIARKDLRDMKHHGRERRHMVSGGRGEKKETSNEDRRRRVEESKKKTTCRVWSTRVTVSSEIGARLPS